MTSSSTNYSTSYFSYCKIYFCFIFLFIFTCSKAQMTAGTSGRFNIPSANMPKDKTFSSGANVLSPNITPDTWDYTTGNYFLNICFLPV